MKPRCRRQTLPALLSLWSIHLLLLLHIPRSRCFLTDLERRFLEVPSPEGARESLKHITSKPHVAGTPGDHEVKEEVEPGCPPHVFVHMSTRFVFWIMCPFRRCRVRGEHDKRLQPRLRIPSDAWPLRCRRHHSNGRRERIGISWCTSATVLSAIELDTARVENSANHFNLPQIFPAIFSASLVCGFVLCVYTTIGGTLEHKKKTRLGSNWVIAGQNDAHR